MTYNSQLGKTESKTKFWEGSRLRCAPPPCRKKLCRWRAHYFPEEPWKGRVCVPPVGGQRTSRSRVQAVARRVVLPQFARLRAVIIRDWSFRSGRREHREPRFGCLMLLLKDYRWGDAITRMLCGGAGTREAAGDLFGQGIVGCW